MGRIIIGYNDNCWSWQCNHHDSCCETLFIVDGHCWDQEGYNKNSQTTNNFQQQGQHNQWLQQNMVSLSTSWVLWIFACWFLQAFSTNLDGYARYRSDGTLVWDADGYVRWECGHASSLWRLLFVSLPCQHLQYWLDVTNSHSVMVGFRLGLPHAMTTWWHYRKGS